MSDPSNEQEYLYVQADPSNKKLKLTKGSTNSSAEDLVNNDLRKIQYVCLQSTHKEHLRHLATGVFVGRTSNEQLELIDECDAVEWALESF